VDLGSGDGRIPIAAARDFGARALGVEFDQNLVELSIRSAAKQGVADRVRFVRQDLFQADLSHATVIALYVSLDIMERLRPKLLALKPGTRVVSHQFTLGDWEPDEQVTAERRNAYLWVVPARVEGTWQLSLGGDTYEIRLEQAHQMLKGSAELRGKQSPLFSAWLRGEVLSMSFVDRNGDPRSFLGRVTGDTMEGLSSTHGQPDLAWTARRQGREGKG
jgi:SAM-dependent methyltransferase